MKQKKIALLLSACMLVSANVSAQTIEFAEDSNIVTITNDAIADEATLFVVEAGKDIADLNFYAIVEATKDSNGKVVFEFEMPEYKHYLDDNGQNISSDGLYDVYYKEPGSDVVKTSMDFSTLATRMAFINALKAVASAEDLLKILSPTDQDPDYTERLAGIGCMMDDLALVDASNIATSVFNAIADFSNIDTDLENFVDLVNYNVIMARVNNCNENEVFGYLKLLDITFDDVNCNDIEDADLIAWINKAVYAQRPYATDAEISPVYNKAYMIYVINHTVVDDIRGVVSGYAQALEIEENSQYVKFKNATNKTKSDEKLVAALRENPATTVNDLLLYLNNSAVNKTNKPQDSTPSTPSTDNKPSYFIPQPEANITPEPKPEVEPQPQVPVVTEAFDDLASVEWAKDAIKAMADKGIIAKPDDKKFRPNDSITREEFVKLLVMAAGVYDENAEVDFTDVPKDAWYYSYVASAYKAGLVEGISETEFGSGLNIKRQDVAVLCSRVENGKLDAVRDAKDFADDAQISDYAKEAVDKLYCAGIINGMDDDMFSPLSTATRAQAALMIYNLLLK